MKLLSIRSRQGFTLIELVVVFSVLSILSTVGIVAFNNYNDLQEVNGSVSNIANILNEAKSFSRSQVKPPICDTNAYTLDRYRITITTGDSSKITLHADCIDSLAPPGYHSYGTGDNPNKPVTVTFPQNIKISEVRSNSSTEDESEIFFYRLFQGKVDGGIICLESDGNPIKSIEVNELGVSSVEGPCN